MTNTKNNRWQDIQEMVRANIQNRTWAPGDLIPGEQALAEQYGCARTTVNRALRELASTGVIDRKREAGTRVALQKARRVSAQIPVIRAQVEEQDMNYVFVVLKNEQVIPGKKIRKILKLKNSVEALHIRSVHYADDSPYIYEDRWINTLTVNDITDVDLARTSANEWLVQHIPFSHGEFVVESCRASSTVAKALNIDVNDPVLVSQRTTWLEDQSVTTVKLYYVMGYQMRFDI